MSMLTINSLFMEMIEINILWPCFILFYPILPDGFCRDWIWVTYIINLFICYLLFYFRHWTCLETS